jgi:hypothetical protein
MTQQPEIREICLAEEEEHACCKLRHDSDLLEVQFHWVAESESPLQVPALVANANSSKCH